MHIEFIEMEMKGRNKKMINYNQMTNPKGWKDIYQRGRPIYKWGDNLLKSFNISGLWPISAVNKKQWRRKFLSIWNKSKPSLGKILEEKVCFSSIFHDSIDSFLYVGLWMIIINRDAITIKTNKKINLSMIFELCWVN